MPADTTVAIRAPRPQDREAWDRLYAGYAAFYQVTQTQQMRDTVWGWLSDPAHTCQGLVADAGGTLVGLAHFRPYARPLSASTGGFLDDLFVASEARGGGVAEALIAQIADIGRKNKWTVLRWITAQDNATARRLYDRVAIQTPWVTYDIKL